MAIMTGATTLDGAEDTDAPDAAGPGPASSRDDRARTDQMARTGKGRPSR